MNHQSVQPRVRDDLVESFANPAQLGQLLYRDICENGLQELSDAEDLQHRRHSGLDHGVGHVVFATSELSLREYDRSLKCAPGLSRRRLELGDG